jgi:DNA polymerase-4
MYTFVGAAMNWMWTDMNSYFASVEQMLRPELRGRPVGVVPVESEGTCVIAASSQAKRFGVKTGTKVPEARRLCPGMVFVRARPKQYVRTHHEILQCVERCVPICKVYSIDEWTIHLTGPDRLPEQARNLAIRIKQEMLREFGSELTCSIGIAPTRLLAKIASKLQKPDGLTLLSVDDLPGRLESVPLGSLYGIGVNMLARLERHGVRNIRELWEISRQQAIRVWGSVSGAHWWAGFHGEDEPEAPTRRRSMTHGNVLEPKFRNLEGAKGILIRLVCRLGQRLRQDGYLARTLQLSVRDPAGQAFHSSMHLPLVHDSPSLLWHFDKLWEQFLSAPLRPFKVDVTVSDLAPVSHVPRSLFPADDKRQKVSATMDQINQRCGASTVYLGLMHDYRHEMEAKIAFGRIPDEAD